MVCQTFLPVVVTDYYSDIVIIRGQSVRRTKDVAVVKKPRHCCSVKWLAAVVSWTLDICQLIQQQLVISTE